MKENFTSINVIIDQSGSMAGLQSDTIQGFNKFLEDQKNGPGEAIFTLCTFSTDYRLVHDFVKIKHVPALNTSTYCPGGSTALLDSIGTTVEAVGNKLASMPEEERPSRVLFLIITDGEENASKKFSKAQIKSMIEHQEQKYSWSFVYFGANVDAISEGTSMGISKGASIGYVASTAALPGVYCDISAATTNYRATGSIAVNPSANSSVPTAVPAPMPNPPPSSTGTP